MGIRATGGRRVLAAWILGALPLASGGLVVPAAQAAEPAVQPPAGAAAAVAAPRFGATGIGVADLQRSSAFYADVLGLEVLRTYELADMDEIVLGRKDRPDGAVLVLMHWKDGRAVDYRDNPVKVVWYVADPKAAIERIRARGGAIDLEPVPLEVLNGTVVGLGRDPDGYVVELIGAP
jgi:catechol 2,3-dioxygenase-like lactoylglutathione lyase family enzyme